MKKINRIIIASLILAFTLAPVSPPGIFVFSQEEPQDEEITGYKEWKENKLISESVYVSSEATLIIKKGITITFKEGASIIVAGKLFVKGTKKDPVKFRKEEAEEAVENADGDYSGYSINITGEAYFKNADITGGGNSVPVFVNNHNFFNQTYAGYASGAIIAGGSAKLRVEESDIHGNISGINLEYLNSESYVKVNRSSFFRNVHNDVSVAEFNWNDKIPDFKYNWWGSSDGPEKICYTPTSCSYKKITGNVNVSSWLTQENFKDPVIIIPGIVGSAEKNGVWQIDPFLHSYDNLYDEFVDNGYIPNQTLFTFPYEWRNSNSANALLLRNKINAIKQAGNWPKVDVVAHSMGGLLAWEYIESDFYQDDVDQLVSVGVPNNGAPEAYLKWEAGAFTFDLKDLVFKKIFTNEAEENGYEDVFHYIHGRPISSVQELLPVYDYLYEVDDNLNLREYPHNYPANPFLENLNSDGKKDKLLYVELDKIVGNAASDTSTIAGFKVIDADMGEYWEHGYPHGFEIPIGDRGIKWDKGDRTVPLISAKSENIFADQEMEINSSHIQILTDAQKDILEILTGDRPENEVRRNLIKRILIFSVYSPIDIQVIAPDKKVVGKNFQTGETINKIDGAYYTRADTDAEFLTIPNPEEGEYKILTQGTGDGDYKIEVSSISEDEDNPEEANESTAEITGTATAGAEDELKIGLDDNKVIIENQDEIAPTIEITSPQEKEYLNNQIIAINYSVYDIVSPADKIISETYYDEDKFTQNDIDLSLEHLGNHQIKIIAKDETLNESEKTINFSTTTDIQAIIDNISHYYELGLITNKKDKEWLEHQLKILEKNLTLLDKIKENDKIKSRVKQELTELFEKLADRHIDLIIRFIENDRHNAFSEKAREILIESLKFLRF